MSTITATEVNNLRKMTGAGLMDCKKALQETNGDGEGEREDWGTLTKKKDDDQDDEGTTQRRIKTTKDQDDGWIKTTRKDQHISVSTQHTSASHVKGATPRGSRGVASKTS